MDRSRHSRGLPRLCTLRQRCRQSPQRSSRVPNRSMWMILYSSVSSTLVTVCAFSPSCFLINVSTSTSILFLSMAVNNSPQRIRCIEVSIPGQPAVKLLEPNHFSSNYTFGTGTVLTLEVDELLFYGGGTDSRRAVDCGQLTGSGGGRMGGDGRLIGASRQSVGQ